MSFSPLQMQTKASTAVIVRKKGEGHSIQFLIFKCLRMSTFRQLLSCWFTTINLTLHLDHRHVLRFAFKARSYEYLDLPSRLSLASHTFNMCRCSITSTMGWYGGLGNVALSPSRTTAKSHRGISGLETGRSQHALQHSVYLRQPQNNNKQHCVL